jgi:hypothetical protein
MIKTKNMKNTIQKNPITLIRKTIRFVKEENLWYVDLPEFIEQGYGLKANLLMVAGADEFLELSSNGNTSVTATVSNRPFENSRQLVNTSVGVDLEMLAQYNHPEVEHGGYYRLSENGFVMWLCPTLLYVFESRTYPSEIHFRIH